MDLVVPSPDELLAAVQHVLVVQALLDEQLAPETFRIVVTATYEAGRHALVAALMPR